MSLCKRERERFLRFKGSRQKEGVRPGVDSNDSPMSPAALWKVVSEQVNQPSRADAHESKRFISPYSKLQRNVGLHSVP